MIEAGIAILFLIPGIAVYCALYGLFSGQAKNIPEPPAAGSIQAVAIVVFACIAIHLATAGLIWVLELPCRAGMCLLVPEQSDLYRAAFADMGKDASTGSHDIVRLLSVLAAQCLAGYWLTRWWLGRAIARNRLPLWIYGWTRGVLNG